MRRSMIITVLFAAMSAGAVAQPFDCDHVFQGDAKSTATTLTDVGAAAVTGIAPLHFAKCPGVQCETTAYVMAGDIVVTGAKKGDWVCAIFPNRLGGTVGWLPMQRLAAVAVNTNPPLAMWAGRWQMHKDASIDIKIAGGKLAVSGQAFWIGSPTNVHDGELTGSNRPSGNLLTLPSPDDLDSLESADNPEYVCAATLRLIGPYLVVQDNSHCGGLNVSFSGVYRRK